jgi:hypothetical protein
MLSIRKKKKKEKKKKTENIFRMYKCTLKHHYALELDSSTLFKLILHVFNKKR